MKSEDLEDYTTQLALLMDAEREISFSIIDEPEIAVDKLLSALTIKQSSANPKYGIECCE